MNIVIVGGGTAGWLVSLYLATHRPQHQYTTIDSNSVGPIGVGEAATGKFNQLLNECGISDFEFMVATDALPKHSLRFVNWTKQPSTFDSPLEYSLTHREPLDTRLFLQIMDGQPIEYASVSGWYSRTERTSYRLDNKQLQCDYPHAMQFDATKTAEFLKSQAVRRGVTHIQDHIVDVELGQQGIAAIRTQGGQCVKADIYIDCSGLSRLLIGKLHSKFRSCESYIHVNSAMLFRLCNDQRPKRTMGVSIARKWGWNFEISTRNRIGSGYVHNRHQVNRSTLLQELEQAYGQSVSEIRTIEWTPGSFERPWAGNCIAMGLSASFLEPLQTGAIHDTIAQVKYFVETGLNHTLAQTVNPTVIQAYNRLCNRLFEDYLDFLSISYCGGRQDSEFWRDITVNKSMTERAKHIVDLAKRRLTRELDFDKFLGYGSQGLYNYTLAGLGVFGKNTVEQIFSAMRVDIDQLRHQQQQHNHTMRERVKQSLTSEELNTILSNESLTSRA